MIKLSRVSKILVDAVIGHEVVLSDASAIVPTNGSVALLSESDEALTAAMLMLTGAEKPDKGQITRAGVRISPLINAGGRAGGSFVPAMTAISNLELLADIHAVDPAALISVVDSGGEFSANLHLPVKRLDWRARQALEVTAIAALPFECYFVDRLHNIEKRLVLRLFHAVRARGAGLVFSTRRRQQAENLAETVILMEQGRVQAQGNLRKMEDVG